MKTLRRAAIWLRSMEHDGWDVLVIAGAASVSYGVWQVYGPAGYITAGILLAVIGIFGGRQ
jgi:hypothetical protein